jgi:hypothetical protein
MHKTIVITDLTQMPKPNEVCVVGVDEQNQSIRPVLPGGVLKRHLYVCHRLVMRPRAKIELKFYSVPIEPPHVEDLGFDPNSIVYKGLCTDVEWEKVFRTAHTAQSIIYTMAFCISIAGWKRGLTPDQ